MPSVDIRQLALRGAQQTLKEIYAMFPELRPTAPGATKPFPKPENGGHLTPDGRRRLRAAMKKRWKVAKANTADTGE